MKPESRPLDPSGRARRDLGHVYRRARTLLCADVNTFTLDYSCRQKTSGMHVNIFTMRQLPVIPLARYECILPQIGALGREWLAPRVLELTYTAWDLQPFAAEAGYSGPPFRWDDDRRFLLRCE